MLLLGIETSCDETAAALVEDAGLIRSSVVASQVEDHKKYGGVVPELASRQHLVLVNGIIDEALAKAGAGFKDIDGVAVTAGPGLVGSLLVGLETAKAIAFVCKKPLIGVNHLEGHLYAVWLSRPVEFPLVGLVVSGGHTELVYWSGHGKYERLGRTRDDAAGEAFDKVAKLLELGYPGGPVIEKLAEKGDAGKQKFPTAKMKDKSNDFSFSGLKTAVRLAVSEGKTGTADLAAGFQAAVINALVEKTISAALGKKVRRVALSGGVAVNKTLRQALVDAGKQAGLEVLYPLPELCTDNAAMIAAAGYWRLKAGQRSELSLGPDPNLELTAQSSQLDAATR